MKILYTALLFLLFTACNRPPMLDLTVKAPSISNGTVMLKQANEIVLTQTIKNGEMNVKRQLSSPGYYSMTIVDNDKPLQPKISYDVYLETTKYVFELNAAHPADYPAVTTTSATQNQLLDYYKLAYQATSGLDHQIDSMVNFLASPQAKLLPKGKRAAMYTSTRSLQEKRRDMDLDILKAFLEKHPQQTIGAHIMAQQYYPENPKEYYAVFEKFSDTQKTSDDGLKINNKLSAMLGVMTDSKAPDIAGNTPDGKPFDKASIKNGLTLVEFWKSSAISKRDHRKMLNGIIVSDYDAKKFGIVSVSLDEDEAQWKKVIKQDMLNWPQVSDLKGDNSPNVKNWNVTKVPSFFLVDKNWHIIKPDIELVDIDQAVHDYFKGKR